MSDFDCRFVVFEFLDDGFLSIFGFCAGLGDFEEILVCLGEDFAVVPRCVRCFFSP